MKELRKKIQSNSEILKKRIDHLKKHERSVTIFLAALSSEIDQTDSGLEYINQAYRSDNSDADVLRCKGYLHLKKNEFGPAEQAFERLRTSITGSPSNRAEAYLGLASVALERVPKSYDEAAQSLGNAVNNLNGVPSQEQNPLTRVKLYQLLGNLHSDDRWIGCDADLAKAHYTEALHTLAKLPGGNAPVKEWKSKISSAKWRLENPSAQGNQIH